MTGTFSYVWDRQTECWQVVSRSGHIVFQSEVKEHVRSMCQHLAARTPRARSASPEVTSGRSMPAETYVARSPRQAASSGWTGWMPAVSWPTLVTAMGLLIGAALAMTPTTKPTTRATTAPVFHATLPVQPADTCKVVWVTEMQERKVRVAKPVVETKQVEQRVKVVRPVVETQQRDETVLVRRPVIETSVRYEKCTVNEPVTVYETRQVDRGTWVQAPTPAKIESKTSLRWVPGGYSTDAQTGVTSWKLPMFRFVKEPVPVVQQAQRVWQPNVVQTQVPRTTYRQRIETRPVQVQTMRYVEEKQTRKVPVEVKRMVEQEEVRQVPVTTERMTYEERIERVPVKVCRRVPAGQSPPPAADDKAAGDKASGEHATRSPGTQPELPAKDPQLDPRSTPNSPSEPPAAQPRRPSRLQPELRALETQRVAQGS